MDKHEWRSVALVVTILAAFWAVFFVAGRVKDSYVIDGGGDGDGGYSDAF